MEPLSITAGVLSLLGVCIKVSVELRKLKNGNDGSATNINALLADVNGLRSVLQLMETMLDSIELRDGFETTGSIGSHWQNLRESLHDGSETLAELDQLIGGLNRTVAILDGPRRYMRIQASSAQIANFRQQIQIYRDAIQFSLHAITFWNSVEINECTKGIGPSIEDFNQNYDRLASNIEIKLQSMLDILSHPVQQPRRDAMERLGHCVRSAATVYSSSTVTAQQLNEDQYDRVIPNATQERDLFGWEPSVDLRLWVNKQFEVPNKYIQTEDSHTITEEEYSLGVPGAASVIKDSTVHASLRPSNRSMNELQEPIKFAESQSLEVPLSNSTSNSTDHIRTQMSPRRGWFRRFSPQTIPSKRNSDPTAVKMPPVTISPKSTQRPAPDKLKVVFVGDGACGKTCFLVRASKGAFPEVYVPTVFEMYPCTFEVDGRACHTEFYDTAGQEDYDALRPLAYSEAHIVFICFAIDGPDSLDNVIAKWVLEVLRYCPGVPIVLAGLKKDLRNDRDTISELIKYGQSPVTYKEGYDLAIRINAAAYVECSAKTGEGVMDAFEIALRMIPKTTRRSSKSFNTSKIRKFLMRS